MDDRIISVSHMMRRALNTLDYKLMDHGERVAYILFKMSEGEYTDEQITKICYIGLFHDIGAYQTEQLDSLSDIFSTFSFEVGDYIPHSVYSYLFLGEHSFFEEFVDALLFHHVIDAKIEDSDCVNKKLARRLFIADRIDVMLMRGVIKSPEEAFVILKNPVFNKEEVQELITLEEREGVLTKCFNGEYMDELLGYLKNSSNYGDHVDSLIHMLPHAIDFRSEFTVTHTIATVDIAVRLAELHAMNEDDTRDIYLGALLHDIGKISVSNMLLEKNGALTHNEFNLMKDHVLLTEYILKGCVSDKILNIAARHHERPDGSGYPHGIGADQLSLAERIVGVADVMSALLGKRSYKEPFPEKKVRSIMSDMAYNGKLCKGVVEVALNNYSAIENSVEQCSKTAEERYETLQSKAKMLIDKYKNG